MRPFLSVIVSCIEDAEETLRREELGELVSTATARNTYANAGSAKSLPLACDPQPHPFVKIFLSFKCDRGVSKGLSAKLAPGE